MDEGKVSTANLEKKVAQLRKRLDRNVKSKLRGLAFDGRKRCESLAKSGSSGLGVDTGALSSSFYARAPGLDDYESKVQDMMEHYLDKYSYEHGAARIAAPVEVGKHQAAFGSASRVMAFWEYGHQNKFTGNFEKVPILRPVREEMRKVARRRFANILSK